MKSKRFSQEKPIGELIQELVRAYGIEHKLDEAKLRTVWPDIVGKVADKYTSRLFLKHNTLHIEFSTPMLKHELQFRKGEMLERLAEALGPGAVTDIKIL